MFELNCVLQEYGETEVDYSIDSLSPEIIKIGYNIISKLETRSIIFVTYCFDAIKFEVGQGCTFRVR